MTASTFIAPMRRLFARLRRIEVPIALLVVGGLVLTSIAYSFTQRVYRENQSRELESQARDVGRHFARRVDQYVEAVAATGGLFATDVRQSRQIFGVVTQRILERNPGLAAIAWIPRVASDQQAAYEQAARADGLHDFRIRPMPADGADARIASADRFPVYFVEPMHTYGKALGTDLATNEVRQQLFARARDEGQTVITGKMKLLLHDQDGVLLAAPVYKDTKSPRSLSFDERQSKLVGFVNATMKITPLLDTILHERPFAHGFDVYLLDNSAEVGEQLLTEHLSSHRAQPERLTLVGDIIRAPAIVESFDVGGRKWSIVFRPIPNVDRMTSFVPLFVACLGALLTAFLALYIHAMRRRTAAVQKLVKERTVALEATNTALRREMGERTKAEQRLAQAQKMQAIGQITGGIAHDFNNILMIIDGYARRAIEKRDDWPSVEFSIKQIASATDKATALTRSLLTFSRKRALQHQVFRIDDAVRDVSNLLRRAVDERFEVVFELGTDEACVDADPSELGQALVNLVVNARDASPADGARIVIGTRLATVDATRAAGFANLKPGRYVEAYVRDFGTGMDEQVLQHVFEPFFTTKPQGQGTGLGLASVYGFCQQSSGAVDVETAVGKGTTVTLILPLSDAKPSAASQEDLKGAPRGNGELILLVEDDEAVLALTKETLEGLGYRVIAASDGFQALEAAGEAEERIALVLSDIVMPGLSGIEVVEIMSERDPETKIVFISGYPGRIDKDYGKLPEGSQFLQKPVKPEQLARVIRQQLDSVALKEAI